MEKRHFNVKRLLSSILCFAVLLTVITPVAAFAEENATLTVKVGFFAFDGYHMQDENGVRSVL